MHCSCCCAQAPPPPTTPSSTPTYCLINGYFDSVAPHCVGCARLMLPHALGVGCQLRHTLGGHMSLFHQSTTLQQCDSVHRLQHCCCCCQYPYCRQRQHIINMQEQDAWYAICLYHRRWDRWQHSNALHMQTGATKCERLWWNAQRLFVASMHGCHTCVCFGVCVCALVVLLTWDRRKLANKAAYPHINLEILSKYANQHVAVAAAAGKSNQRIVACCGNNVCKCCCLLH